MFVIVAFRLDWYKGITAYFEEMPVEKTDVCSRSERGFCYTYRAFSMLSRVKGFRKELRISMDKFKLTPTFHKMNLSDRQHVIRIQEISRLHS